jgi:hypothetical protein
MSNKPHDQKEESLRPKYEMAGGTKRSTRRRVGKKKTEPAAPVSVAA